MRNQLYTWETDSHLHCVISTLHRQAEGASHTRQRFSDCTSAVSAGFGVNDAQCSSKWRASFAWSISCRPAEIARCGQPGARTAELKLLQHSVNEHSNKVPLPDAPQDVEVPVVELTCWVSVCDLGKGGDGKGHPFAKQQAPRPLPFGFLGRVFQHALTVTPARLRTRIRGPLLAGLRDDSEGVISRGGWAG